MIISFEGEYKSLRNFVSEDLENFALIIGKNGSGKTQLIELIDMHKSYSYTKPNIKITLEPAMNNIQVEGLAVQNIQIIKGEVINKQIEGSFHFFQQIPSDIKLLISDLIKNGLNLKQISWDFDFRIYMSEKQKEEKSQRIINIANKLGSNYRRFGSPSEEELFKSISSSLNGWKKILILASQVAEYKNKPIESLTINDFSSSPLIETHYINSNNNNPFSIQVENLLYNYARKRFYNEFGFLRYEKRTLLNNFLSNENFIHAYPPPWEIINKILESHNLKFRIPEIDQEEFSPDYEFKFTLIDIQNNTEVKLEDLSSGEKIIIGLILRLFLTSTYSEDLKFPDCIILDEPDAFLHPEMSSLLIEVLHRTFVQELGIRVILTTHSPATVALAPEDCIYELQNGKNTSLKKILKDNALKMLTGNLPLLSIDYKNHRQVFVESPTDQYYFQTIFNKLNIKIKTKFDLYFITTGYGKIKL